MMELKKSMRFCLVLLWLDKNKGKNKNSKLVRNNLSVLHGINNRKRNIMLLTSPRKSNRTHVTIGKQGMETEQKIKRATWLIVTNNKKGTVALPTLPANR